MIATEFTDWARKPTTELAKFRKASPALVALRVYIIATYGGADLGIYGVRSTRNGKATSTHSFGAAWDWSYRGKGRAAADSVIELLINNSAELGVQAIHDYLNCRIWHAGRGWKAQRPDQFGMGQTWGDWLHVEVNERQWADDRPVEAKLGKPVRRTLQSGDRGEDVKLVQTTLASKAGQSVTPDGVFGTQTEIAVRNVQSFVTQGKGPVTGVVDNTFWGVIDMLNGKKP